MSVHPGVEREGAKIMMANSSSGDGSICGGEPFWNTTLLVEGDWPRFTDCFINTVLVWTPCLFLWLPLPFYLHGTARKHDVTALPVTCLNSAKTFFSAMLSLLGVVILIQHCSILLDGEGYPVAVYLADALRIVSYACAAVLTQWERKHDVITSGVQFTFWLILSCCDIIPFYTLIIQNVQAHDLMTFSLYCVIFGFELVQLVLFCFSEAPSYRRNSSYHSFDREPCPEVTASFLSQIMFAWMTKFVYRGWRKDLEENDLFNLNPRDTSRVLVPPFEHEWFLEKQRFHHRQMEKMDKDGYISMNGSPDESFKSSSGAASGQYVQPDSDGLTETTALVVNRKRQHQSTSDSDTSYGSGERETKKGKDKPHPSLFRVLAKLVGPWLVLGFLQKVASDCFFVLSPVLLGLLIDYAATDNSLTSWQGYSVAVLMFLAQVAKSVLFNFSFWSSQVAGMQLKTMLIAAIYKKSLTMNSKARRVATGGEIVNLMSVDCQRIQDVMNFFFYAWTTPIQVVMVVAVLYFYIGPSVFAGVITLILLVPLNSYTANRQQVYNRENLKVKDDRLRLTNEVLSGMKVLKLYAWEPSFEKKICDIREKETRLLMKIAYLNITMGVCWYLAPFLVTLATFACFVESSEDNVLDARRAFVTLSLLNMLRVPLALLATIISMTAQAIVSIQRINKFLCVDDLDPTVVRIDNEAEEAVSVRGGTFTWDRRHLPLLRNLNLSIGVGKLVAVVGPVGSGKSSLISACLGEMEKITGRVTLKSAVAYVPQQAWIQNATLRDNILFGKHFDERRYKQVLRTCALKRDLEILSAGDMTEIGEKGINLSGGQKQRVSLARAVYSDSDIFFFDDPLSAVDSHVGKHIFNKVMGPKGVLRDKTRVLVTHGVHWLPMVDEVLVMSEGTVTEQGTYDQLLSHNGPFAQFLKQHLLQRTEDEDEDPEISSLMNKIRSDVDTATSDAATSGDELNRLVRMRRRKYSRSKTDLATQTKTTTTRRDSTYVEEEEPDRGRLTRDETMESGKVKRDVFLAYLRSAGTLPFSLSLLFFMAFQAASAASNFWLSTWTDDPFLVTASVSFNETLTGEYRDRNNYYLTIFGVFGIAQLVTVMFNNVLYWVRMVVAAKTIHHRLLVCVLRAPMAFFDTTPIGRMMNRFSRDVETMDNNLPIIIKDVLNTATLSIVTIVVISISTPLFLILVVPVVILFFFIQSFYIPTSRQLKRIESVTRSPIYTHFSETISGGPCIRAYRATERFLEESKSRVDRNQSFYFASVGANRWLGMNLEMVANVIVFGAAIFAVVTPGIEGGAIGLSVSYAMQISSCLTWMVRQLSDLETNIVSVERIKEYSELDSEAPWVSAHRRPVPSWPINGRVMFSNYSTRYRPGLDLVLKGVTFTIEPGQKVGIVGRTGAGKSSLTLSLFRLIESAGGCIMIDGVNIADIGLHDLRSRITILPQDPVLFSGSLRMNLDPLDQYSDDHIWKALDRAHLTRFAEDLPEGLDYDVGEEGQSLSVGQRQLVCLARTLLRRTKILVLDEATAAVDMETDNLIQNTIRSAFSHSTIITIAHRLHTIMDYDRVLVLGGGLVKEFDAPHVLLADRTSIFYGMAKDADLV
ncbi:multidrug resistance-associated protein 1-like [Babylonia areolata]|uniref:multidrug resistance-associated protein 1-like n=1 Tax=Babylonia areolata TaxID=304850 RepID=UPI003FD2CADB